MNTEGNKTGKKALVLGAGAPNSALIAGALVAFIDRGITFDVVSTSGAGALVGLLYACPNGGNPKEALTRWPDVGVHDQIYNWLPANYKVFMKPGVAASMYRGALSTSPFTKPLFDLFSDNSATGLWADAARLFFACLSPTDLTAGSKGLSAHMHFAEDAIDFDALRTIDPDFYISAYNLSDRKMEVWGKDMITAQTLRAAFSYPFIYSPCSIGGSEYIEGAALRPLNFDVLLSEDADSSGRHSDIDSVIVLDVLRSEKLIQSPRNLHDAWVRSIMVPLGQAARNELELFQLKNANTRNGNPPRKILVPDLTASIPDDYWPKVIDWSSSNMHFLFDVGYAAVIRFCNDMAEDLAYARPRTGQKGASASSA